MFLLLFFNRSAHSQPLKVTLFIGGEINLLTQIFVFCHVIINDVLKFDLSLTFRERKKITNTFRFKFD